MAFDIREEDEELHDEFEEYADVKQAERPKFYRRRKFWYFCIPNAIITLIIAVVLALYVIMPKIAQGLMNKSTIEFSAIDITNPTATNMDIVMKGEMKNTGPFHADISFPGIVTVSWDNKVLGTTEIPGTSSASGGHGDLDLASKFTVTDAAAFTEFSSFMLNAESFVWHLEGKLNVKALGHTVKDLDLKKDITVSAFHGLSGIKIEKFSLPGDDPTGKGILIEIDTAVTNPSAIQMYMGSLTLAISYKDVLMGYVTSDKMTMVRGPQTLKMKGVLVPQTTPEGLAVTSDMMSRYIANVVTDTTATGFDCKPDGVNSVDWLSAAVKNLKLTVPLQSPAPLQLIKALNLGALGLTFTPPTAYEPITTSTGVLANYTLPDGFGFGIQFTQVSNSFALYRNGIVIAGVNSSYNPSTSNMAEGTMTFDLLATPLMVPAESHTAFQEFNRDLTVGSNLPFQVVGQASVFANTSIGVVNLVNIPFNASTELSGLQSLANPAPTITSIQVVAGTATEITMAIGVVIVNPSSISLSAGDVVLDLIYGGARLGTVTMPNLAIVPGANTIQALSSIDPAASPQGIELLTLYTSGAGAAVNIAGTPSSTAVESLSLAFGALSIGSQMPGLETKLLAGASLVVLDTTLVDGLAQTVVTINNPFVPPMTILSIDSTITYNGASLGTVVATFGSPPVVPGTAQGTITAALAMNTNPHDLVTLILAQAKKNGLNTDAFEALLSLQNGGNPDPDVFVGFNVADFTLKAMAGLVVDITMSTTVKVGDYQVTMPYTQTGVPTATDNTILKLIPIVGTPIAQMIVDKSILGFSAIQLTDLAETAFKTNILGAITETGPLDAKITFPNPVTISFEGKAIGSMMMPEVNAVAGKGAALDLVGVPFTVVDLAAFTDFNIFALNNEKFEWTIATDGIVVSAMGAVMPGVKMTKKVILDGFNGLKGLTLTSYLITLIDDAGMHLEISAVMANPSTIGMTIPVSNFDTIAHGVNLGPAVAENLMLTPHGSTSFPLKATIAYIEGRDISQLLTGIFMAAVNGQPADMEAVGKGAPGISWLDAAIKTLKLHTQLPPLPRDPIKSVVINAMSMDFSCATCEMRPLANSTITAETDLPFVGGPPIDQLSQDIRIMDKDNNLVGTLKTAMAKPILNGNFLTVTTPEAELIVPESSRATFIKFIGDINDATKYNLGLEGTSASILNLGKLGMILVPAIPLKVVSNLDGLQGLKTVIWKTIIGMDFAVPGFMAVSAIVNMVNPSQLTLKLGNLKLSSAVEKSKERSRFVGYSTVENLVLKPGENIVLSVTNIDNSPDAAGGEFSVKLYEATEDVPLYLFANDQTTTNPNLNAGLASLDSTLMVPPAFGGSGTASKRLYTDVKLSASPQTVIDGLVDMTMTFQNPYYGVPFELISAVRPDNPLANKFLFTNDDGTGFLAMARFLDNFKFRIENIDDVKTVTFKVQLVDYNYATVLAVITKMLEGSGNAKRCVIEWDAWVRMGNAAEPAMSFWGSSTVYMDVPDFSLPLAFGEDIKYILEYYKNKQTTTVAPLPPPPTDSALPPATTTIDPPVETTVPPVQPTVAPTVAPTAAPSPPPPEPTVAPPAPSPVPSEAVPIA